MNFGISSEVDADVYDKSIIINKLSQELKDHFKFQNYGNDLLSLTIGTIVIAPEHEHFFKVRKPKYYDGKKTITHDGITIEVENALEYDIKLDHERFKSVDQNECLKMLAQEIFYSIDKIDTVKKIKDFDKERFKADLESYFRERDLI